MGYVCYMLFMTVFILQLSMQANWVINTHDPHWHIFMLTLPFVSYLSNFLMVYIAILHSYVFYFVVYIT